MSKMGRSSVALGAAALVDMLGIDRVVVAGYSAGSTPAIRFALRFPGRGHLNLGHREEVDREIQSFLEKQGPELTRSSASSAWKSGMS